MVARVEGAKSQPRMVRLGLWLPTVLVVLAVGVPFVARVAASVAPLGYAWARPANTGSMEPVIDGWSLLIERRARPENLRITDVIDFTRPSDGHRILHRIADIREDAGGRRWFTTKGDANEEPDPEPVTLEVGDTYKVIAIIPNGVAAWLVAWALLIATPLFIRGVRLCLRATDSSSRLMYALSIPALSISVMLVSGVIDRLLRTLLV